MRQANGRRQGEYHRGNESRNDSQTEQHQCRDQVDEGGERLHQVENRAQCREQARPMCRRDPQRPPRWRLRPGVATMTSERVSSVASQYP